MYKKYIYDRCYFGRVNRLSHNSQVQRTFNKEWIIRKTAVHACTEGET